MAESVGDMRDLNKQDLYDLIGYVLNVETAQLGPGSKEHLKILKRFARQLGVPSAGGKHEIMKLMLEAVGQVWDGQCFSTGETVTVMAFQRLLNGLEAQPDFGERTQEGAIQWRRVREFPAPPRGQQSPTRIDVSRREFRRDVVVAAYALAIAEGVCRGCGKPAPFIQQCKGQPFLEVHHVVPLSEGGPDTVENVIAVCPNCHRRAHHSVDRSEFQQVLKQAIRDRDEQ